jgi:hypothetical protein
MPQSPFRTPDGINKRYFDLFINESAQVYAIRVKSLPSKSRISNKKAPYPSTARSVQNR